MTDATQCNIRQVRTAMKNVYIFRDMIKNQLEFLKNIQNLQIGNLPSSSLSQKEITEELESIVQTTDTTLERLKKLTYSFRTPTAPLNRSHGIPSTYKTDHQQVPTAAVKRAVKQRFPSTSPLNYETFSILPPNTQHDTLAEKAITTTPTVDVPHSRVKKEFDGAGHVESTRRRTSLSTLDAARRTTQPKMAVNKLRQKPLHTISLMEQQSLKGLPHSGDLMKGDISHFPEALLPEKSSFVLPSPQKNARTKSSNPKAKVSNAEITKPRISSTFLSRSKHLPSGDRRMQHANEHKEGPTEVPAENPELLAKSIKHPNETALPTYPPKVKVEYLKTECFAEELKTSLSSSVHVVVADSAQSRTLNSNVMHATDLPSVCAMVSIQGCKAAHGKSIPNQDRAFLYEVSDTFGAFGIFDGHGDYGHDVADAVASAFLKKFQEQFPPLRNQDGSIRTREIIDFSEKQFLTWLKSTFRKIDSEVASGSVDLSFSGCTASVAVRYHDAVYVGYVGDSKVVGFHFMGPKPVKVMETLEHTPASEIDRIQQTGAHVSQFFYEHLQKDISRIMEAGISVSRAFGDLEARKFGLLSQPEFVKFDRTVADPKFSKLYHPLMLVMASDGLWDTVNAQEVLDFCRNEARDKATLVDELKKMSKAAWERRLTAEGRSDDTTVLVALF